MKKLIIILILMLTLIPLSTCFAEDVNWSQCNGSHTADCEKVVTQVLENVVTKSHLEKRLVELKALLPQIEQAYGEVTSRIKEVEDLLKILEPKDTNGKDGK